MRVELEPTLIGRLRSVRHYDGLPIDARSISDAVREQEGIPRESASMAHETEGARGGE
jgi:hypothetical protein